MIKENELRVGNFVYNDENIIMKVASIETQERNDWNGSEPHTVIFQSLEKANDFRESIINSIPLTEKIAEQFGFTKDENSKSEMYRIDRDKYQTISLLFHKNGSISPFIRSNHHEAGEHYSFIGIRYVHQLQNLYFSLTHRELEFSTNGI